MSCSKSPGTKLKAVSSLYLNPGSYEDCYVKKTVEVSCTACECALSAETEGETYVDVVSDFLTCECTPLNL